MKSLHSKSTSALTLVEVIVVLVCGALVAVALMLLINTGTMLFARNVSTNVSHLSMRTALDRIGLALNSAAGQPALVDATGGAVASGPAAGVRFDQNLGGPYVVVHPGGPGLSASATEVTIIRSLDPLATPPLPANGDVLLLDGAPNVRLHVESASAGAVDGANRQTIVVTLDGTAGTPIPWTDSTTKIARLVRAVAFVVVPLGGRNQLRYFGNAETVTNFTTGSGYSIVCDNIGSGSGDETPFSLSSSTDSHNRKYLDMGLRIRAREFDVRLASQEKHNFSSVMKLNVTLAPKGP